MKRLIQENSSVWKAQNSIKGWAQPQAQPHGVFLSQMLQIGFNLRTDRSNGLKGNSKAMKDGVFTLTLIPHHLPVGIFINTGRGEKA